MTRRAVADLPHPLLDNAVALHYIWGVPKERNRARAMTRTPPAKPRPTRDNDRFGPVEEEDLLQAEVLGEYLKDDRSSAEAYFHVLGKIEEGLTRTDLPAQRAMERGYSPSAAILRSRRPSQAPTHRHLPDAGLGLPTVAGTGPPLPAFFVVVAVLVALAL